MIFGKQMRSVTLTLAISITFMTAMIGCGNEEDSRQEPLPAASSDDRKEQSGTSASLEAGVASDPVNTPEHAAVSGHSADKRQSLEQVSARDGEKYIAALKLQDAKALSSLMSHAENAYTEADMQQVLEGFLLYFDSLDELKLRFEANVQNDAYYIEQYAITGSKDGTAREIPFEVSYAKSQELESIQDDGRREPLYDSPLIGQYPYAVQEAERYLQALQQKDAESLALHLGMYDDNEETKETVERMLQKYKDSLDLRSVKISSKGYYNQNVGFGFELRDSNEQTHELRVRGGELRIVDDWAKQ